MIELADDRNAVVTTNEVAAIRAQLWDGGFRPVPIYNYDDTKIPERDRGKRPLGNKWTELARHDPPDCLDKTVSFALNTGILCDGLRPFDLDIDDAELAGQCRALIINRLGGDVPLRYRSNSGRCLLLYRAVTGEPKKVVIAGSLGKVEVLGHGQQFVAHGVHVTGAVLEWFPEPPWLISRDSLEAVTEEQVHGVLIELAALIEAELPKRNGHDRKGGTNPQADQLRVAAALQVISNDGPADWQWWNSIGMAVWRATDGSNLGFEAWNEWSKRNPSYAAEETRARWDHYSDSPPDQIGAGTLFHMAAEARLVRVQGSVQEPPPGWLASHPPNEAPMPREAATSPTREQRLESDLQRKRDPRRKAMAKVAFRLLRQRVTAAQLVSELHRLNQQTAEPLSTETVNCIGLWAAKQRVRPRHAE